MEQKDFMALVEKMRKAQVEFFKTRDRDVLHESKRLERQVDEEIRKFNSPQGNLF